MPPKRKPMNDAPSSRTRSRRVVKTHSPMATPTASKGTGKASAKTGATRSVVKEPNDLTLTPKVEDVCDLPATPLRTTRSGRKPAHRSAVVKHGESPNPVMPENSEHESESDVSPRRWKKRAAPLDSDAEDEVSHNPRTPSPKRIRRGRLPQKLTEVENSEADSADNNDLELSPPPRPSKPTKKELMLQALQQYKKARNTSPSSPRKSTATEEVAHSETSSTTEDTEMSDAGATDGPSEHASFINDEDETAEGVREAENALGPEQYSRRNLEEHFKVVIEYAVRRSQFPSFLADENITEDQELSYGVSLAAMRLRTEAVADSMLISTWSGPFTYTLNERPVLVGPITCEPKPCQACWTRGSLSCSATGSYTLSTRKGFYDTDTYQDESEKDMAYSRETTDDFQNSAHADQVLYPPGFRLVVGARCARRAAAYHQARHYMYNIFTRVQDETEGLCDASPDLANDERGLLDALAAEFIPELWHDFNMDSSVWKEWRQ
ncbi:hypothetical protein C8R43DRAFT_984084 [Mycena crocata]|nr:hypothetical protein C8R43DRAFT_984084 [Mycena crocata]